MNAFNALGPSDFQTVNATQVETLYEKIVRAAQGSLRDEIHLNMTVPAGCFDSLRLKLIEAGFTKIVQKSDYRDGNFVTVTGNPFAQQNCRREAAAAIEEINRKMRAAYKGDKSLSVDISVPYEVQEIVKQAYLDMKWSAVTFISDRDGSSINFRF